MAVPRLEDSIENRAAHARERDDGATRDVKLVVLMVIDQLRADRIPERMPGGIGRLFAEGRSFPEAAVAHAVTESCPGHAVILTGRHPGPAGVPGDHFVSPGAMTTTPCFGDASSDARVLGREPGSEGRSPRNLRVTSLGDWMKAQLPGARVFSVSADDRAAIALGGRRPDGAYWLERDAAPRFTTSAYYMNALPEWVAAWGPERLFRDVPDLWRYKVEAITPAKALGRVDPYEVEDGRFGLASPHPIKRGPGNRGRSKQELQVLTGERLSVSPYLDQVTLDFASELMEREGLGAGSSTDLLALSLSAMDVVGHSYGPESWEAIDTLLRLDQMLGAFLEALEGRVSPRELMVVLTADHGVLAVPEWLLEQGKMRCTIPDGRGDPDALVDELGASLDAQFGSAGAARYPWFIRSGSRLTVHPARVRAELADRQEVLAAAEEEIEALRGVAAVWTGDEASAARERFPMAALYANSWDAERTGDLAIQFDADCLYTGQRRGTGHGSPYDYDRAVPLVFFGEGISSGRAGGAAATVDIAPTLAAWLGVTVPGALDGRVLPLR